MLRHIVLITYASEATEAERAAHRAAVAAFRDTVPGLRAITCGVNIGTGPNHHDFAMVADFEDWAAFRAYMDGPVHAAYVATHARHVGRLSAIQHEV